MTRNTGTVQSGLDEALACRDMLTTAPAKPPRMARLVEAAGRRLLLLPSYSPDFNPIEQAFAKVKAHLRAAAARTFDVLVAAIGAALDAVTPANARGCIAGYGYHLPGQLL